MKNVSAGIFIKNGFILIAKRGKNEKLAGYWEFPGGKQEDNETIFECLEREIYEEFNVKCKAKEILSENVYTYESGSIKLIAILSDLLESEIKLSVHEKYKWIKITDLNDYKLAPADIPIAKKIIEKYETNS